MLTPAQKQTVGLIVEGVKQKRAAAKAEQRAAQQGAQDRAHQVGMEQVKGAGKAALAGAKPKANAGSKAKPGANSSKAPVAAQPYLTGSDLMAVSDRTAQAENTDAEAKFGYAQAAANALLASGDIERGRQAGVSAANDDAAARGLYDSGIREQGVGRANMAAVVGQSKAAFGLKLAEVQAGAQRQAARNQLGDFLSATTVKAAENAAALPVDPYSQGAAPGANVPGAATVRRPKPTTKRRPGARLKPGSGGKALI